MKTTLFTTLALAIFSTAAFSQETAVCFKRVYSAAHLKANPNQTLKMIQITLTQEDTLNISIDGQTRSLVRGETVFQNGGMCGMNQGILGCDFGDEIDGSVTVQDKGATAVLRISQAINLYSYKTDNKISLKPGKVDGVYLLHKTRCN